MQMFQIIFYWWCPLRSIFKYFR